MPAGDFPGQDEVEPRLLGDEVVSYPEELATVSTRERDHFFQDYAGDDLAYHTDPLCTGDVQASGK
jgi:hypothetical protein